MNNAALRRSAPTAAVDAASTGLRTAKGALESYIQRILDEIDAEHRDPDEWEIAHLTRAVRYTLKGWYAAALYMTECSLDEVRPAKPWMSLREGDETPNGLHKALDRLKSSPPVA